MPAFYEVVARVRTEYHDQIQDLVYTTLRLIYRILHDFF